VKLCNLVFSVQKHHFPSCNRASCLQMRPDIPIHHSSHALHEPPHEFS
jgi:hypothetical protein